MTPAPAQSGYYVQLLDGPAEGWAYVTAIPPEQTIIVAPAPRADGGWFRVPYGSPPWIGEVRYRREELPKLGEPLGDEQITSDGDILVSYRVKHYTRKDPLQFPLVHPPRRAAR